MESHPQTSSFVSFSSNQHFRSLEYRFSLPSHVVKHIFDRIHVLLGVVTRSKYDDTQVPTIWTLACNNIFLFCGWHLDHGQELGVKFSLPWVNDHSLAKQDCWGLVRYVKLEILKQGFHYSLEKVIRAKNNKSCPRDSIRGSKESNSQAGCHLPARMTAGESVNFKTALKSP